MSENTAIQAIAQKIGIPDFKNLTLEEQQKLANAILSNELDKKQIEAVVQIVPGIVSSLKEVFIATTKNVSENQVEAFKAIPKIEKAFDVLNTLSQGVQDDATRERLATELVKIAEQGSEVAKTAEKMNNSNNNLWTNFCSIAGGISLIGLSILGTKYYLDSNNGNNGSNGNTDTSTGSSSS